MAIDPLIFWDMRSVAVRTTEYTDTQDHNVLALVAAGHGSWVLPPPHGAEGGRMTNHRHSDVSICRRVKLRLLEGGTCRGGLVHVQECGHHNEKASSGAIFYHSGVMRLHVPPCPGYISKVKPSIHRQGEDLSWVK